MDREYRPAPMSLAQRAALRAQDPRVLRQPARRRIYPLVAFLVVLALIVIAAVGFEYRFRDRILPNIHAQPFGVDLGSQTQADAAAALRPLSVQQRFRTVMLLAPGRAVGAQAYQLGYSLDGGLTAWRAFNLGHGGSILHRLSTQASVLLKGAQVDAAQRVNARALQGYLTATLAPLVHRAPRPGVAGRRLDVAAAQRLIAGRLVAVVGRFSVHLPLTTIPALPAPPHHEAATKARHKTIHKKR